MSDRLLLRLASDGSLTWLRMAVGARAMPASTAGVPPGAVVAAADEIVVLVPAEDVLLTEVKLNARNRATLLQALPYAVEEQLLAPVETLHFAASQARGDGIGVAVVAKEKMHAWLARLDQAGVRADVLLPESLALPASDEATNVVIEDARAIVRVAPWSAFACAVEELPAWLEQARAAGMIRPLAVNDFRVAPALGLPAPIADYRERQRDPLALLASALAAQSGSAPTLNLLDGAFGVSHRQARGERWWRVAAALAAAVMLLALLGEAAQVVRLSRVSARLDTLAHEAVRTAFPDIDAAQLARLSPDQLMRGRLERLRGGVQASGLLPMLAQMAPVLGSTTRIQTRGMEYRAGVLELGLRAPDVAALDSVRERLATLPGVQATVTAANPGAEGVDGRIRVASSGGTP